MISQGHSDAVRRIKGVKDAKQYTIPVEAALEAVRNGENPELTTRQKHTRECFVVAEEGADLAQIENDIKTMPNYFSDYDTTVHFISEEELKRDHSGIPHGGFVIRSGKTGWNNENNHVIEYSLKLDSNPEFTSSVLVAYARAAYRMNKEGQTGAKTVFDVAPAYLSNHQIGNHAQNGTVLHKAFQIDLISEFSVKCPGASHENCKCHRTCQISNGLVNSKTLLSQSRGPLAYSLFAGSGAEHHQHQDPEDFFLKKLCHRHPFFSVIQ